MLTPWGARSPGCNLPTPRTRPLCIHAQLPAHRRRRPCQVEFHTSTLRGAGTDATVFFDLFGERSSSGVVRVSAPVEAFERGTVDAFTFKLRHLGRLAKMVVGHDNAGRNAAWHLLKVVVTSTHPEEPYVSGARAAPWRVNRPMPLGG